MKPGEAKILWHSVNDVLPDGPATVLVSLSDPELPVWLGWFQDEWHSVDGGTFQRYPVTHWADLPSGPSPLPPLPPVQN